jgi:hypothetical protein
MLQGKIKNLAVFFIGRQCLILVTFPVVYIIKFTAFLLKNKAVSVRISPAVILTQRKLKEMEMLQELLKMAISCSRLNARTGNCMTYLVKRQQYPYTGIG